MSSRKVTVSLDQLLLARAVAPRTSKIPGIVDRALADARKNQQSEGFKQLAAYAASGAGTVLPFIVDAIDVDVAAILLMQKSKGVVFSSISRVEAGFAVVTRSSCRYVDRYTDGQDPHALDFEIVPGQRNAAVNAVLSAAVGDLNPRARGTVGTSAAIRISWDSSQKPVTTQWKPPGSGFQLIDPGSKARTRVLPGLVVDSETENSITIAINSPESMIRLSAAAGRLWLSVDTTQIRAVLPVPDFDDDAPDVPARVSVVLPQGWAIGRPDCGNVEVSESLAAACLAAFRWFTLPDPGIMVRILSRQMYAPRNLQ